MLGPLIEATQSGSVSARHLITASAKRIASEDPSLNSVVGIDLAVALATADRLNRLPPEARAALPLLNLPLLVKDIENAVGCPRRSAQNRLRVVHLPRRTPSWSPACELPVRSCLGEATPVSSPLRVTRPTGSTARPKSVEPRMVTWRIQWRFGGGTGGWVHPPRDGNRRWWLGANPRGPLWFARAQAHPWPHRQRSVPGVARPPYRRSAGDERSRPLTAAGGDGRCCRRRRRPGPVALQEHHPVRRILVAPRLTGVGPLHPVLGQHLRVWVERLGSTLGVAVEHTTTSALFATAPGLPSRWDDDWYAAASAEQAHLLGADTIARHSGAWDPTFEAAMEHGLALDLEEYLAIRRRNIEARRVLDRLLTPGTLLVTPVLAGFGYTPVGCVEGSTTPGSPMGYAQTMLANITGHPAISMPAGLIGPGLP